MEENERHNTINQNNNDDDQVLQDVDVSPAFAQAWDISGKSIYWFFLSLYNSVCAKRISHH